MPQQLSFDLPVREVLGRDDFFVAPSNAMAVAMIDRTEDWPAPQLVLTGPEGAGKTHLTHVWADQTGARIVAATALGQADIPALCSAPVAVEDVPQIANDRAALEGLFHLYNMMRVSGKPLLLTGRGAPHHWNLALADAQSRIQAVFHVTLDPPDDTVLAAVLAKLFADRQITPQTGVIPFLVKRIERSFAAAAHIVQQLDAAALDQRREVSSKLAGELLEQIGQGD